MRQPIVEVSTVITPIILYKYLLNVHCTKKRAAKLIIFWQTIEQFMLFNLIPATRALPALVVFIEDNVIP